MRSSSPPTECAQCGAALPPRARACPECGADERTGWREVCLYDGLDLPDEAWRGDDAPSPRHSSRDLPSRRVNGLAWYWWALALTLLFLFGLGALALG